jgi:hypothetical protein
VPQKLNRIAPVRWSALLDRVAAHINDCIGFDLD